MTTCAECRYHAGQSCHALPTVAQRDQSAPACVYFKSKNRAPDIPSRNVNEWGKRGKP